MAVEGTSSTKFEMCVVYDEFNLAQIEKVILTPLKEKGIVYCELAQDIRPGQHRLKAIAHLLEQSKCILIIHPIQEELNNHLELVCSDIILSKQCISLSLEEGNDQQESDVIIISKAPNWLEEVLHRMTSPVPIPRESDTNCIFIRTPQATTLAHHLFNRGFHKSNSIDMNILGVQIMHSSREVKLDLSYYMKNIESHEKYQTDEIMKMLQLGSISTQVQLRIDAEAEEMIDIASRGVDKIFSTICSCVLDVRGRKLQEWILTYTLSGPLVVGREFMHRTHLSARYAVLRSSFPNKIQCQDYVNEQTRKETFKNTIFHTKAASMAGAGYFYDGLRDRARCYYCGGARVGWKESVDPWIMHAEGFPQCPLVKANMPTEVIEKIVLSAFQKTLAGNHDYDDVEKRKLTLQNMVLTPSSKKNGVCKKKFLSDMAEAGFYYVGPEDRVKCFSCGLSFSGIRLRTLNDLLIKHACLSSSCEYVKSKLSPDKLQNIIDTIAVSDECLSVTFFVKTFDRCQSEWPSNMLS